MPTGRCSNVGESTHIIGFPMRVITSVLISFSSDILLYLSAVTSNNYQHPMFSPDGGRDRRSVDQFHPDNVEQEGQKKKKKRKKKRKSEGDLQVSIFLFFSVFVSVE